MIAERISVADTGREIAEGLYRGTATCTSTLGRGTTITLELPAKS
jgi:hypothetical protein